MRRWPLAMVALTTLGVGLLTDVMVGRAQTPPTGSLVAHVWNLVELDGQPVPLGATATFMPSGAVMGSAGCDRYEATWIAFGADTLVLSSLATTRGGCDGAAARRQSRYIERLREAAHFSIVGDRLTIPSAFGGSLVFRVGAPGPGLVVGRWQLAALDGRPVPSSVAAAVTFDEAGTIAGTTGCNDVDGRYAIDGAAMTIGPVLATMAICDTDAGRMEDDLLAALGATAGWSVRGDTLRLRSADGAHSLELAADRPLVFDALTDARWTLSQFGTQAIAPSDGMTATFGADGTVTGSGGCDDYAGTYSVDGAVLHISALTETTAMTCEQRVMDNQAVYLQALEGAIGWKVPQNHLWIATSGGTRLVFDAALPGASSAPASPGPTPTG